MAGAIAHLGVGDACIDTSALLTPRVALVTFRASVTFGPIEALLAHAVTGSFAFDQVSVILDAQLAGTQTRTSAPNTGPVSIGGHAFGSIVTILTLLAIDARRMMFTALAHTTTFELAALVETRSAVRDCLIVDTLGGMSMALTLFTFIGLSLRARAPTFLVEQGTTLVTRLATSVVSTSTFGLLLLLGTTRRSLLLVAIMLMPTGSSRWCRNLGDRTLTGVSVAHTLATDRDVFDGVEKLKEANIVI